MGFEILSEDVEWEARRIAAAFRMPSPEIILNVEGTHWSIALEGELSVEVCARNRIITSIDLGRDPDESGELFHFIDSKDWTVIADPPALAAVLARALYRLGFEDRGIFAQLPPLTAHEQLELRLAMPREFWPKKWCDEEMEQV